MCALCRPSCQKHGDCACLCCLSFDSSLLADLFFSEITTSLAAAVPNSPAQPAQPKRKADESGSEGGGQGTTGTDKKRRRGVPGGSGAGQEGEGVGQEGRGAGRQGEKGSQGGSGPGQQGEQGGKGCGQQLLGALGPGAQCEGAMVLRMEDLSVNEAVGEGETGTVYKARYGSAHLRICVAAVDSHLTRLPCLGLA